ncbi:MAG: PilZ domain-containing protein, partial [Thiotrichales bacterium]|nr:PilZ domain-containing protein [Thiotrichales bacterium]
AGTSSLDVLGYAIIVNATAIPAGSFSIRGPLNVSYGGLAVHFPEYIEEGTTIELLIDVIDPHFVIQGVVVWSRQTDQGYDLGIRFADDVDVFRMRMIEQICHIEHYRQEVEISENRRISSEEAAVEWIEKYAEDFPTPD